MVTWTHPRKVTLVSLAVLLAAMVVATSLSGCTGASNRIRISGAFALSPMMDKWVQEYRKVNSSVTFDIQAGGAGKGMTDALSRVVEIGMVSREIRDSEAAQGAFWVSVCKDAVVATINTDNPVFDLIQEQGLSQATLVGIFIDRNITTWGQAVGSNNTDPIHVFTRSDSCGAAETWAKYLGNYTQGDLTATADSAANGDDQLAQSVVRDRLSIGFNNIGYVYDENSLKYDGKITPVPLDLNANGTLDDAEKVYQNRASIVSAINTGAYPSPPARNLHLVTYQQFTGITKDFVRWILTDGQEFVLDAGYVRLSNETIAEQLQYLESGSRPTP